MKKNKNRTSQWFHEAVQLRLRRKGRANRTRFPSGKEVGLGNRFEYENDDHQMV